LNKTSPLKKLIFALFLINSLCLYTQTKSYVREYNYKAGENDSYNQCKVNASKEIIRILLEEIGVYVSCEFENEIEQKQVNGKTEFNQLIKSKINQYSAGIAKLKALDERFNGETFYLKAEIIVDIDDANKKLKEFVNYKLKIKELEDIQAKNKKANDEIDKLKKESVNYKAKIKELEDIQAKNKEEINILDAQKTISVDRQLSGQRTLRIYEHFLNSVIWPGWGYKGVYKNKTNTKILGLGIFSYCLIGNAILFNKLSKDSYNKYLTAKDNNDLQKYYNNTNSFKNVSLLSALASSLIITIDLARIVKRFERAKRDPYNNSKPSDSFESINIDY